MGMIERQTDRQTDRRSVCFVVCLRACRVASPPGVGEAARFFRGRRETNLAGDAGHGEGRAAGHPRRGGHGGAGLGGCDGVGATIGPIAISFAFLGVFVQRLPVCFLYACLVCLFVCLCV